MAGPSVRVSEIASPEMTTVPKFDNHCDEAAGFWFVPFQCLQGVASCHRRRILDGELIPSAVPELHGYVADNVLETMSSGAFERELWETPDISVTGAPSVDMVLNETMLTLWANTDASSVWELLDGSVVAECWYNYVHASIVRSEREIMNRIRTLERLRRFCLQWDRQDNEDEKEREEEDFDIMQFIHEPSSDLAGHTRWSVSWRISFHVQHQFHVLADRTYMAEFDEYEECRYRSKCEDHVDEIAWIAFEGVF